MLLACHMLSVEQMPKEVLKEMLKEHQSTVIFTTET